MKSSLGAQIYDRHFVPAIFEHWTDSLLTRLEPLAGATVLDLGCGTGVAALAASRKGAARVIGVDRSPFMLSVARTKNDVKRNIEWIESLAHSVPLPDNSFERAVCQQGLQFFSDRKGAVAELHRVLIPGGRLALSVWKDLGHNPVHQAFDQALRARIGFSVLEAGFSLGDEQRLHKLFEQAGFTDIRIETESRETMFPSRPDFYRLSLQSAELDPASLPMEELLQDMRDTLVRYGRGQGLRLPMSAWILTAKK